MLYYLGSLQTNGGDVMLLAHPMKLTVLASCCAGMLACSSGGAVSPPTNDVSSTDQTSNCECTQADQCTARLNGNPCLAATCDGCICGSQVRDVTCDDGKSDTVNDRCGTNGICSGTPSMCGDHVCNPNTSENCDTCGLDCACATGTHCKNAVCIKDGVCPNTVCEDDEDCSTCALDCACADGKACLDGTCLDCPTYCTTTEKARGLSENCNCGDCLPGFQCDQVNHCYEAFMCGNTKCEAGETCANCAPDCPCRNGQRCGLTGVCEDCQPLCDTAGKECGMVDGCACGSCPTCYTCNAVQKCMADCDCVCYHKECGEIGACNCGSKNGLCPEGQECNAYKCTDTCDTLCAGTTCGWSPGTGECICGFCEGCEVCNDSATCVGGAAIDEYENNDSDASAYALGTVTDNDSSSKGFLNATIDVAEDWDWFQLVVTDTSGHILDPVIKLSGLAQDKDLDLVVCWVCKTGTTTSIIKGSLDPEGNIVEIEMGIDNSLCLASLNLWGEDETISLNPKCSDSSNDSGTLYMLVLPVIDDDCGSGYRLDWHM